MVESLPINSGNERKNDIESILPMTTAEQQARNAVN